MSPLSPLSHLSRLSNLSPEMEALARAAASLRDPLTELARGPEVVLLADRRAAIYLDILAARGLAPAVVASRDPGLFGARAGGRQVVPAEELPGLFDPATRPFVVLLAVPDTFPAARLAAGLGAARTLEIFHALGPLSRRYDPRVVLDNLPDILSVGARLADRDSRRVLAGVLGFRLSLDPGLVPLSDYPQYFHPRVLPAQGDVIIDAGAYDGDTALSFVRATNGKARLYAFEPDPANAARLRAAVGERGLTGLVRPVRAGLWRDAGEIAFAPAGGSSTARPDGAARIRVVDLDGFCRAEGISPGFIKMDIEGAEPEALYGARRTLAEKRPRLAVCVYHEAAHPWEIPRFLAEILPGHALYLGHHDQVTPGSETVLYAAPADGGQG